MNKMVRLWLVLIVSFAPPTARAQQAQPFADFVERVIKAKEPQCVPISRISSGGNPEEEEYSALFNCKLKGQEISFNTAKMKTVEGAGHYYIASTATQITRPSYKLTSDGERLKRLVDQAEFFKNESARSISRGRFSHATFEVAFRKGKVVIVVEARKREVAQRIALYIAEALPAK